MTRFTRLLALLAVLALVATACNGDGGDETTGTGDADSGAVDDAEPVSGEPLSIAFFASSSQNGYNQAVWEGVQAAAAEAGDVTTEIYDGEFSADVQFNQLEDITTSGRFDGFVIVPNDTVGITPAVEAAVEEDIRVATALFPIGPDLDTLEPQVEGMITAAAPVRPQSRELAEGVVEYCEDIDPCRVVIMIGQLQFPFDNARYEAMTEVLAEHDNIEVVATGEGNYDRDQSLSAMQDIIQANREFEVLLSNADQHVAGATIALEEAGFDVEEMYVAGGGATAGFLENIRAGRWEATATSFPYSEGYLAATNLIRALRGEDHEQVIDMTQAGPFEAAVITAETLEEHPDFEGEWDA